MIEYYHFSKIFSKFYLNFIKILNTTDMAKDKPAKETKKEPGKTLKEKRAEKQEKKNNKRD